MKKIYIFLSFIGLLCFLTSCLSFNAKPLLFNAVSKGDFKKVIKLVERGADINGTKWGITPLEKAALDGKFEIFEYLFSNNAKDPQKAFEQAIRENNIRIAKYIIDSESINVNLSVLSFRSLLNNESITFEQRIQNILEITGNKLNSPMILRITPVEKYNDVIKYFI